MSTETIAIPTPNIGQWWATTKTAVKTCVAILAIIGATHITEPLRADPGGAVVQPAQTTKAVVPGK